LGLVALASVVVALMQLAGLPASSKAVVFLPVAVLAALWWGPGPGVVAALGSALAFDVFFIPPYYSLTVADRGDLITLLVYAAVALFAGVFAARLRRQVQRVRATGERSEALYRLSRALSGSYGGQELALNAERELAATLGRPVMIYLPEGESLEPVVSSESDTGAAPTSPHESAVATWAFVHGQLAGHSTDTLAGSRALNLPLVTAEEVVGVLALDLADEVTLLTQEDQQLLETIAAQIGAAIKRDQAAEQTRRALLETETERTRKLVLGSLPHDLRTSLAVITGTSSALLELGEAADAPTRLALLSEVFEESSRLTRMVENFLRMADLDSGVVALEKEWFPLEDVIGSTLALLHKELRNRTVNKHIPAELPIVVIDGVLIEQVLFNLIDNAVKYSPTNRSIDLSVLAASTEVVIEVADRGAGILPGEADEVFDKFYRGKASETSVRGAGLGLAIAKAIVAGHGGRIWASNRPGGGAVFAFSLPLQGVTNRPAWASRAEG
jgi:two-component system sensor histidine kinase KdpD